MACHSVFDGPVWRKLIVSTVRRLKATGAG